MFSLAPCRCSLLHSCGCSEMALSCDDTILGWLCDMTMFFFLPSKSRYRGWVAVGRDHSVKTTTTTNGKDANVIVRDDMPSPTPKKRSTILFVAIIYCLYDWFNVSDEYGSRENDNDYAANRLGCVRSWTDAVCVQGQLLNIGCVVVRRGGTLANRQRERRPKKYQE